MIKGSDKKYDRSMWNGDLPKRYIEKPALKESAPKDALPAKKGVCVVFTKEEFLRQFRK